MPTAQGSGPLDPTHSLQSRMWGPRKHRNWMQFGATKKAGVGHVPNVPLVIPGLQRGPWECSDGAGREDRRKEGEDAPMLAQGCEIHAYF